MERTYDRPSDITGSIGPWVVAPGSCNPTGYLSLSHCHTLWKVLKDPVSEHSRWHTYLDVEEFRADLSIPEEPEKDDGEKLEAADL